MEVVEEMSDFSLLFYSLVYVGGRFGQDDDDEVGPSTPTILIDTSLARRLERLGRKVHSPSPGHWKELITHVVYFLWPIVVYDGVRLVDSHSYQHEY